MMRAMTPTLVCPIAHPQEAPALLDAGADELYLGLRDVSGPRNRREMAEASLPGWEALARVVDADRPVSVTLNAPFYDDRGLVQAVATAHRAAELGVRSFIVADLGLLTTLRKELPAMELHASAVTGVLNGLALEALAELGVDRVILPRHLRLPELSALARHSPVPLEVFVLDWKCPNLDAWCGFAHEDWAGVLPNGCCLDYRVTAPQGADELALRVESEYRARYAVAAAGCAACVLPALQEAGIHHWKLVGRRLDPAARLANLRLVSALRDDLKRTDFEDHARALREAQLGHRCPDGACYYRP